MGPVNDNEKPNCLVWPSCAFEKDFEMYCKCTGLNTANHSNTLIINGTIVWNVYYPTYVDQILFPGIWPCQIFTIFLVLQFSQHSVTAKNSNRNICQEQSLLRSNSLLGFLTDGNTFVLYFVFVSNLVCVHFVFLVCIHKSKNWQKNKTAHLRDFLKVRTFWNVPSSATIKPCIFSPHRTCYCVLTSPAIWLLSLCKTFLQLSFISSVLPTVNQESVQLIKVQTLSG